MITIDGAAGEGGGQMLRSALALSVCGRIPFRMIHIRARRSRPGLRPQHLAAVRAAAAISDASVEGAAVNATELTFSPRRLHGGTHRFSIGTAGSTMLLLQAVLPALVTAPESSEIHLQGGTHNPQAPTFEFLERAYLPLIARMGPRVSMNLERVGLAPAGGGNLRVRIEPVARLDPLRLESRGALRRLQAEVLLSRLPEHIAQREAAVLAAELELDEAVRIRTLDDSSGPGNVVSVFAVSEQVTEVFAAFGRRGLPAERVARDAASAVKRYLAAEVPVGPHLADQLLLPLALAGAGSFVTLPPSGHVRTNIGVIQQFLPVPIHATELTAQRWKIEVGSNFAARKDASAGQM